MAHRTARRFGVTYFLGRPAHVWRQALGTDSARTVAERSTRPTR